MVVLFEKSGEMKNEVQISTREFPENEARIKRRLACSTWDGTDGFRV